MLFARQARPSVWHNDSPLEKMTYLGLQILVKGRYLRKKSSFHYIIYSNNPVFFHRCTTFARAVYNCSGSAKIHKSRSIDDITSPFDGHSYLSCRRDILQRVFGKDPAISRLQSRGDLSKFTSLLPIAMVRFRSSGTQGFQIAHTYFLKV